LVLFLLFETGKCSTQHFNPPVLPLSTVSHFAGSAEDILPKIAKRGFGLIVKREDSANPYVYKSEFG
jgi:hypothetical protein